MTQDFIDAMAQEFFEGTKKKGRVWNDWKALNWSKEYELLYTAKLMGHLAKAVRADNPFDKKKHLAAVACNANILWFHSEKET